MNKIFLIGNLTRDPELTETPSGVSVCRFTIAVNRNYTDASGERQSDFFNCQAWRGLGETVAKYVNKGKKISVVGSLQFRNYEDKNGVTRTVAEVIVSDVEFLSPKSEEAEQPQPKKKATLQDVEDDDLPF